MLSFHILPFHPQNIYYTNLNYMSDPSRLLVLTLLAVSGKPHYLLRTGVFKTLENYNNLACPWIETLFPITIYMTAHSNTLPKPHEKKYLPAYTA